MDEMDDMDGMDKLWTSYGQSIQQHEPHSFFPRVRLGRLNLAHSDPKGTVGNGIHSWSPCGDSIQGPGHFPFALKRLNLFFKSQPFMMFLLVIDVII